MRALIEELRALIETPDPAAVAAKLTPAQRKLVVYLTHAPGTDVRHPAAGTLATQEALLKLGLIEKPTKVYPKGADPENVDPLKIRIPLNLTALGKQVGALLAKDSK